MRLKTNQSGKELEMLLLISNERKKQDQGVRKDKTCVLKVQQKGVADPPRKAEKKRGISQKMPVHFNWTRGTLAGWFQ